MGFKETYEAIPKTEYMRRFEAIYDEALLQQETPPADPSEVLFLYQEIEKLYLACGASRIEKDSGSGYYSADAANLVDNTTDIGNLFAQIRATMENKAKIAREQLKVGQKNPKKTEAEEKAEKKSVAPWYHRKFNEFARDFETLKEKKKTLKLTDEAYLEKLEALHLAASRELGRLTLEKKMDLSAEKALVASIEAEYPKKAVAKKEEKERAAQKASGEEEARRLEKIAKKTAEKAEKTRLSQEKATKAKLQAEIAAKAKAEAEALKDKTLSSMNPAFNTLREQAEARKDYQDNRRPILERRAKWPIIGILFAASLKRNDEKYGVTAADITAAKPVAVPSKPTTSGDTTTRLVTDLQSAKNNLGDRKKSGPPAQPAHEPLVYDPEVDRKKRREIRDAEKKLKPLQEQEPTPSHKPPFRWPGKRH